MSFLPLMRSFLGQSAYNRKKPAECEAARPAAEDSINEVTLIGEVKEARTHDGLTTVAIKAKGLCNTVTAAFYDAASQQYIQDSIYTGAACTMLIKAYVRTRKKEIMGSPCYFQDIVGTSIGPAPTRMEAAFGCSGIGTAKIRSENTVILRGEVAYKHLVQDRNGNPICTLITLKTVVNGKLNLPKVTFYSCREETGRVQIGDHLMILGRVQVRKERADNGKCRYTEYIAGTELQKYTPGMEHSLAG